MIDKHVVAVDSTNITFGGYDESRGDIKFMDFAFDSKMKLWTFKTNNVKIAGLSFLSNETLISVYNYVPGLYLWTTDPLLPSKFTAAMEQAAANITCTKVNKVATCMLPNSTCESHFDLFSNLTFDLPNDDRTVFHIHPSRFLKQEGKNCAIQITVNAEQSFTEQNPKDVIYIGEDLFQSYYVVFDYDSGKIGLSGYTTTFEEEPSKFPLWAILLIVGGVIAIIAGIAIVLVKRRKQSEISKGLHHYNELEK